MNAFRSLLILFATFVYACCYCHNTILPPDLSSVKNGPRFPAGFSVSELTQHPSPCPFFNRMDAAFSASGDGADHRHLASSGQVTYSDRLAEQRIPYILYSASDFAARAPYKTVRPISIDDPFDILLLGRNVSAGCCDGCTTFKSVGPVVWSDRVPHAQKESSVGMTGGLLSAKWCPTRDIATNGRYTRLNNASDFNLRADAGNTVLLPLGVDPRPLYGLLASFDARGVRHCHFDFQVVVAGKVRRTDRRFFERECNRRSHVIDPHSRPADRIHIHLDYLQDGSLKLV